MKLLPIKIRDNLHLRQLRASDIDTHWSAFAKNQAHINRWEDWARTTTREEQVAYLQQCKIRYENNQGFACGIWHDDYYVGIITAYIENSHGELSYWLDSNMTGKGIMTQCLNALIEAIFASGYATMLQLVIAIGNTKSQALAERLGFSEAKILHNDVLLRGKLIDRVVYRLYRHEIS